MRLKTATVVSGMVVVALLAAGCDEAKERVQSVFYNETEQTVPGGEDDEQQRQQRTVEGGDRPGSATVLELSDRSEKFYGELEAGGATEWFELTVDDGETRMVDLVVIPEEGELDGVVHLEVDGEDEAPLRYDVAGAGEAEEVPLLEVPGDGPRRFSVSGADDSTGAFEISVRPRLSAATVATAPNDVPAEAQWLEVPGEIQGFYDRPHDRDVFFVDGDSLAAGIYTLELSAVPGLEQQLEIYGDDQLDEPLNTVSVGENAPAIIPNLSLDGDRGDDEGLYFVLTARDGEYHRERGYRLRLVEHPDIGEEEFTVEREPNDTEGAAQSLDFGETIRGYFHTRDDVDRFRFEIDAPDEDDESDEETDDEDAPTEYDERPVADESDEAVGDDEDLRPKPVREMLAEQAEFEEPDEVDEAELRDEGVEIVDPWDGLEDGEPPEYVVQARLRPLTEAHRLAMTWLPNEESDQRPRQLVADEEDEELILCNRVLQPGRFDLEVESERAERDFRVRSYDYELELENIAQTPGLEVPPNDEPAEANRLEMDSARVGYIGRDGEVDYYAFVVGPDEPRLVDVDDGEEVDDEDDADGAWEEPEDLEEIEIRLRGNPLDLQFEIFDDEEGRVARVDDGGPGADEELNIDLPHGLYYVAVRAASGSVCEPYELEVTGR